MLHFSHLNLLITITMVYFQHISIASFIFLSFRKAKSTRTPLSLGYHGNIVALWWVWGENPPLLRNGSPGLWLQWNRLLTSLSDQGEAAAGVREDRGAPGGFGFRPDLPPQPLQWRLLPSAAQLPPGQSAHVHWSSTFPNHGPRKVRRLVQKVIAMTQKTCCSTCVYWHASHTIPALKHTRGPSTSCLMLACSSGTTAMRFSWRPREQVSKTPPHLQYDDVYTHIYHSVHVRPVKRLVFWF